MVRGSPPPAFSNYFKQCIALYFIVDPNPHYFVADCVTCAVHQRTVAHGQTNQTMNGWMNIWLLFYYTLRNSKFI